MANPVVDSIDPVSGSRIQRTESVAWHVTDDSGSLALVVVYAIFPGGPNPEIVYDGASFLGLYATGSTSGTIANGKSFNVARQGGWPCDFRRMVTAVDPTGGVTTQRADYVVIDPDLDKLAPTVGSYSPPVGTPIARSDIITYDVLDDGGVVSTIVVTVNFPDGSSEVVYDGAAFSDRYVGLSTKTPYATSAVIQGGVEPYVFVDGYTIDGYIDDQAFSVTLTTGDFADISAATATELVDLLTVGLTGIGSASVVTTESGVSFVVQSITTGVTSTVEITSGHGTNNAGLVGSGDPYVRVYGKAGWRFRVRRVGGWPDTPTIGTLAVDPMGRVGT